MTDRQKEFVASIINSKGKTKNEKSNKRRVSLSETHYKEQDHKNTKPAQREKIHNLGKRF